MTDVQPKVALSLDLVNHVVALANHHVQDGDELGVAARALLKALPGELESAIKQIAAMSALGAPIIQPWMTEYMAKP